jgi:hypothetical protein
MGSCGGSGCCSTTKRSEIQIYQQWTSFTISFQHTILNFTVVTLACWPNLFSVPSTPTVTMMTIEDTFIWGNGKARSGCRNHHRGHWYTCHHVKRLSFLSDGASLNWGLHQLLWSLFLIVWYPKTKCSWGTTLSPFLPILYILSV